MNTFDELHNRYITVDFDFDDETVKYLNLLAESYGISTERLVIDTIYNEIIKYKDLEIEELKNEIESLRQE